MYRTRNHGEADDGDLDEGIEVVPIPLRACLGNGGIKWMEEY
jgi:hypothetical protein